MYRRAREQLVVHAIKPTRQRLALTRLLFDGEHRHVTAEQVFDEALSEGADVSLATVYNTLNHFAKAGLLHEVTVDMGQSYFDTNTLRHHHFFDADSGRLTDIAEDEIDIAKLPKPPAGRRIDGVEVIVRLRRPDP